MLEKIMYRDEGREGERGKRERERKGRIDSFLELPFRKYISLIM